MLVVCNEVAKVEQMNTSSIVQKLWNYCNGPGLGQSLARSPACEQAVVRRKPRLALRDDGMSYGDYVEQLTYLLFGYGRRCAP